MRGQLDILLIEDSPSQALAFQLLLQRAGYSVAIASDGVQGYWQARTVQPRMVLLDVDLPRLNGFQVLDFLKHHRITHGTPVVMLTDRDRVQDVERALALGADDYLPKQDALTQLCVVVQQIIGQCTDDPDAPRMPITVPATSLTTTPERVDEIGLRQPVVA